MVGFVTNGFRLGVERRLAVCSPSAPRRRGTVIRWVTSAELGTEQEPYRITVLKGDGKGPEMAEIAVSVLEAVQEYTDLHFDIQWADFGEPAIEKYGSLVPKETVEMCKKSHAVLKSYQGTAKGGPVEENGQLVLRSELDIYAQLLPTRVFPQLLDISPFKASKVADTDILLLREISGGALGERETGILDASGEQETSVMRYRKAQVERFATLALSLAEQRSGTILNVDRADTLDVSKFWRENIHAVVDSALKERSDVEVNDMFMDDFCRVLVVNPKEYDLICTSNLFGDVLATVLAGIAGPARIAPTTWIGPDGVSVHGPADMYNAAAYPESKREEYSRGPIAMIRAVSMLLRYGLDEFAAADLVQKALMKTFDECVTDRLASYLTKEQLGSRQVVNASQFRDNLVTSIQYMRQFEMVCDPVECGE